jgi:RNA polymerase sigma factor (sigma-70 family)
MGDLDFTTEWQAALPHILAVCRRTVPERHEVDDIVQEVARRSLRGLPSFRGDCSFLSWVLTITHNEIKRFMKRRARRLEVPLDTVREHTPKLLPTVPPPTEPSTERPWLREVVQAAVVDGYLTDAMAAVLLTHSAFPELTWTAIGQKLGLSANRCAVTQYRALTVLRVYLFIQRPDLLGGRQAITAAWQQARTRAVDPLTAEEVEVFQELVLEQQRQGRRRRGHNHDLLRRACLKVGQHLALP